MGGRRMLDLIAQGRRQWPHNRGEARRTLRHLLEAYGRR